MIRRIVAASALTLLFAATASAHSRIAYSTWDTTYYTAQGSPVRATVQFQGKRGTYRTTSGTYGWLYNIQYSSGAPGGPAGVTVVSGDWKYYTGQRGDFTFYINDHRQTFDGRWSDHPGGPQHRWDGRLRRYDSPAPANPPATSPSQPQPINPPQPVNPPSNRPQNFNPQPQPNSNNPPLSGGNRPGGGNRPSGPPTIGADQLQGNERLQSDSQGRLKVFDSNGRFKGFFRQ